MTGHTKKQKSNTSVSAWTVKGIEIETRVAIQKAAKKEGMTLGRYCNTKLREAAHESLKTNNLPLRPEDLKDEIKNHIDSLKEDLHKIIKEALVESSLKKKSLLKKIFK